MSPTAVEGSPLRALHLRTGPRLGPFDDDTVLIERMRHLAVARDQSQCIRIARRLDRKRDKECDDRFAGQVKITAKVTKAAMTVDRRYVDAAT
jgi:hypothetical protein